MSAAVAARVSIVIAKATIPMFFSINFLPLKFSTPHIISQRDPNLTHLAPASRRRTLEALMRREGLAPGRRRSGTRPLNRVSKYIIGLSFDPRRLSRPPRNVRHECFERVVPNEPCRRVSWLRSPPG